MVLPPPARGAGTLLPSAQRFVWVSLPLGLALGSPIFPSGCEGKLGVALESLQGLQSSVLACRIPWTEEPGRLQSMGSQTVGHNCIYLLTYLSISILPQPACLRQLLFQVLLLL